MSHDPKTMDPAATLVGRWQHRTFDPRRLAPVGCWDLVGGDSSTSALNRFVRRINPHVPRDYGPAPVYGGWPEYFQRFEPIVEWLAPGWLKQLVDKPTPGRRTADQLRTAASPVVLWHAPHGKIDEARTAGNMDFYSSLAAREAGLPHLVDGFYEGASALHALGVTPMVQDGSPSHNGGYARRGRKATDQVLAEIMRGRICRGLDASVVTDVDGIDGQVAAELHLAGDGVQLEGVLDPTDPVQRRWLTRPYGFTVIYEAAAQRILPHRRASWAEGKWPVAGTAEFQATYGDRLFVWQLMLNEDGLSFPGMGGTTSAKLTYLDGLVQVVRRIRQLVPRSVVLLPRGVPELAASVGVGVERFEA